MPFLIKKRPLVHKLQRLRQGRRFSLSDVAESCDILCEEERVCGEKALALPGQFEHAVSVASETTKEIEFARVHGHVRIHQPTLAYHLRSVEMVGGSLYCGGNRTLLCDDKSELARSLPPSSTPTHIARAGMATSFLGTKYFGHWLRDDVTRYYLAQNYGTVLSHPTPHWPDKATYASLFSQTWADTHHAHIDALTVFEDFSQNSLKRKRYEACRALLRTRVSAANPGALVYLSRGSTGVARPVSGEDALIEQLSKRGFTILSMENYDLGTLLSQLLDARLVVTVEGSQQNHALYTLANSGGLLTLQLPDRFNNHPQDWCECLGLKYGYMVGQKTNTGTAFDLDTLLRTVDLFAL